METHDARDAAPPGTPYDRSFAPFVLPPGLRLRADALPDARWAALVARQQLRGVAAAGVFAARERIPTWARDTAAGRGFEALASWLVPEIPGGIPTSGDAEFAYQRFAGINPVTIARARGLDDVPARLRLDDARFGAVMGAGQRLADRVARGDVFVQRYDALRVRAPGDLQPGRFVAPAQVLFCHAPEMDAPFSVAPVAIACAHDRADGEASVYTPCDRDRWRAARRVVGVADVHMNELCIHLARTHTMTVPFAMALRRTLPPSHPLHALLMPHLRFTPFIEFMAWRQGVRDTSGVLIRTLGGDARWSHDVARSQHHGHSFRELGFERDLAARGLDDHPVEYPYRDDGRLLAGAIARFVGGYLRACYPRDAAVRSDAALRAFFDDVASPESGNVRGLLAGARLTDVDELVDVVAQVLFTAGPMHALAHYAVAAHLQRVDENPAFLTGNPLRAPHDDAAGAPGRRGAAGQFARVHGTYVRYDTLGDYARYPIGRDPRHREAREAFRAELADAERTITARNATRLAPFIHFLPSRISNGVSL